MTAPLIPLTGQTRGGLPLSRSSAPSADLAPYILRNFVTVIDQPDDQTTTDFLLNETAFIRILRRGYWEAEIEPGRWRHFDCPLLFGAQGRRLNIRCRGPMGVLGCALRPAGWRALFDEPANRYVNRLTPLEDIWGKPGAWIAAAGARIDDPLAAIEIIESSVRRRLSSRPHGPADCAMARFERIALDDPNRKINDIASELGLSLKRFEARTLTHFGLKPKTVLRRSRFLDLAATMRGIATPTDEELAALRFYDQSHLTREFRHFSGMTPGQFLRTPTPLLTTGIEARQLRKAEDSLLVTPGARAPWAS